MNLQEGKSISDLKELQLLSFLYILNVTSYKNSLPSLPFFLRVLPPYDSEAKHSPVCQSFFLFSSSRGGTAISHIPDVFVGV